MSITVKFSFGWSLPLKVRTKIIWEHIVNRSPPATQIVSGGGLYEVEVCSGHKLPEVRGYRGPNLRFSCNEVYNAAPPHHLSVPCQPCVQLWSRIVLQRTHQRVWLIWAVLPRRMGLLSKNTPSQFGTTLISHINIHLRAPKLRGHTGGGGSVSCLSFTNNMTRSLALLVYTTLKMHSTLVWSSILRPINCNIIRIWP